MRNVFKHLNPRQICALLKKDFLVRIRQPWMTILQFLWPCAIFLSLYILRSKYQPWVVPDCQFPTRGLPSNDLLPFFQSYICTIENQCMDTNAYEEVSEFRDAPVTPVLNIVQTFLNDDELYEAIISLPKTMEFIPLVTKIATHSKFKYIESQADYLVKNIPKYHDLVGTFDPNRLFSDNRVFSNSGKILCARPFPRSKEIRFVNRVLGQEDFNGPDKDEIDSMPTPYCKQLYIDVTNSNNGKITWRQLKPIIQGKILYGPGNADTHEIARLANKTFNDMNRVRELFKTVDMSIKMLSENGTFRQNFDSLVNLAKSPFVKALLGDAFDASVIETVLNSIVNDPRISNVMEIIGNIFDCFSSDRFIAVESEKELEDMAYALNHKKMFYAGVFFTNLTKDISYKLRMNIDDTPITIESRSRFWFPGNGGSFAGFMRYHRGFVEIQNTLDTAIIKLKKKQQLEIQSEALNNKKGEDDGFDGFDFSGDGNLVDAPGSEEDVNDDLGLKLDVDDKTTEVKTPGETTTETSLDEIYEKLGASINLTNADLDKFGGSAQDLEDFLNFDDDEETNASPTTTELPSAFSADEGSMNRHKRQIDLLGMLFGGAGKKEKKPEYEIDEMKFYTKQFPYPSYIVDNFKKGLFLAQAVQMSFFFALIIHIASTVRHKIWMKESGNLSLMRTMGLKESSETISWILTTIIELAIVFVVAIIILYAGGILNLSSKLFIYVYLLVFGLCIISFCYMTSAFFSSASIGSVSTVILFLITFMPYIIIISLGAVLSSTGKFFASLSLSTSFCYCWHYILRTELQQRELGFSNAFAGDFSNNDMKFGFLMIIFDIFLYAFIGFLREKYWHDEDKFYKVNRQNINKCLGAQVKMVTKIYDASLDNKAAVDNVSMDIKKDEILCLLGRNGSGKSTIIKMLTGQIMPTFGEIVLPVDYDLITGFKNPQEQIGLCSQNNILLPSLTAREHLELYSRIKLKSHFNAEVRRVMENLKLGKYKNYRVDQLSGGFKRRLCIAIAFLGSPNLVILDEPCSSVDTNARKTIWELIETLRKGRAVVLATHDLDEAQHLGDNIIIMKNGEIALECTTKRLQDQLTKSFALNIHFNLKVINEKSNNLLDEIKKILKDNVATFDISKITDNELTIMVPYAEEETSTDFTPLFKSLEILIKEEKISDFNVVSKNLDDLFQSVEDEDQHKLELNGNHLNNSNNLNNMKNINNNLDTVDLSKTINGMHTSLDSNEKNGTKSLSTMEMICNLLWKRMLHFRRNYRLLVCVLLLPVLFEIIAMGFMLIRPPGDYDNVLDFNKTLYPNSFDVFSGQDPTRFGKSVYESLTQSCPADGNCQIFDDSAIAHEYIFKTNDQFLETRYGGISINKTRNIVWYNNNGYHSMPLYLNILNSAVLKRELNDSSFNIKIANHPLKLGEDELTLSSILQQVADAGISLILLVAFSLVLAGGSVYLVNERVSGEKLQQSLCGVNYKTYWFVAYFWDFIVYCIAIVLAAIVFKFFAIPIYVEKDNLDGICLLLLLYGFASIPAVHVFEKLFSEASFANMSIFCINIIVALSTLTTIIMFDVLGETEATEKMRNFLNRAYLIFPQHALSDGLIEICRNHITSKIFKRFYINTYKSPITTDLLRPHYTALVALGFFFIILNMIIESKILSNILRKKEKRSNQELSMISIQNSLKKDEKVSSIFPDYALKVENLYKKYDHQQFAVDNVSFSVKKGETYGLLGSNGAGKSSIFAILSGANYQTSGSVEFLTKGLSYCPQTNALDLLLTVEEIIQFYGKLRNIKDIQKLTNATLKGFHLDPYKKVLVKNLSGGNRRKLSVAICCFGKTSVVLMDEPTNDMDLLTRSLVYKTIKELNDNDCAVILTSHSVSEIEQLCHSIGILSEGKMIACGTPDHLKQLYGNRYMVSIFSEKPLPKQFESDIRKTVQNLENLMCHHYSAQFIVQVKYEVASSSQDIQKDDYKLCFSELVKTLNQFTDSKDLKFTISSCKLEQVYDKILYVDPRGQDNNGFVQNE